MRLRGNPAAMWPFSTLERLERAQALDPAASTLSRMSRRLVPSQRVRDALHGVWLGHPLHPALAQLTLSSLLSASMIDAVGGGRRESTGLILAGLLSTPLTAAAGTTDFSVTNPDQQRVGLVHAALNSAATACYVTSLVQRYRGRSGRVASVLGGVLSSVAAGIGGHLAYRQSAGPNHADRLRDLAPHNWQTLARLADLPDGEPVQRTAGDVPVLVLRRGATVDVLSDRCPHLAGPLHEGAVTGSDGDLRVTCPWHGSEFRVSDGEVVHGPATAPAAAFETRVVNGNVEVRLPKPPG